ncbi:MAG: SatD family protein [Methanothrix sp.]|nr:SatD family protein [Methanothrix sp.]
MKQKLFVLLGDVVSSRQITDRDRFQSRLAELCSMINAEYANDIYAPFKGLKGLDEIGGVLKDISNAFNIIILISEMLYPCKMRCSLVYDFVDTALDSGDVAKMDGPAFHRASKAILELKETELLTRIAVEDEVFDKILEGEINLILLFKEARTLKQRKIIKEYELIKNQTKVAERLKLSQQYVSMTLKCTRWKMLKDLEEELNRSLHSYQQRIERKEERSMPG